jgi:hypothetical protein
MLILKILWTLPQTLFGVMFWIYLIATNKKVDRFYWSTKNAVTLAVKNFPNLSIGNGINLGEFILMKAWASNFEHELKHYKQQLWFGWLWLPVYLLITGVQMLFGVPYNETLFER